MNAIAEKYNHLLKKMQEGTHPIVLVNGCTHGHEHVGSFVIDVLKTFPIQKGTLITNIANEQAFHKNVPFIASDLNRSFPGKNDGTYEEYLAYHIEKIVRVADVVIDIHSTNTTPVGENSALIVTKLDKATLEHIRIINPPNVLIMKHTADNALISRAHIGLGFEYGRDKDKATKVAIVDDIRKLLIALDIIQDTPAKSINQPDTSTDFYEISGALPKKEGWVLEKNIKNFTAIPKGTPLASRKKQKLYAPYDFYPILFGENRYETIFGFMGEKIDDLDTYIGDV